LKLRLFMPSELACGERGRRPKKRPGHVIEPDAPLVFDAELLAIKRLASAGGPTAAAAPRADQNV